MKRKNVILLLLLGALIRVVFVALPGTRDVPDWKATSYVASQDFTGIYGRGGSPPDERVLRWQNIAVKSEYPPISQFEMAMAGRLYRLFDPEFKDSALLTAFIKAPGLLAEIVLVFVLLTWGRRQFGDAAEWAALTFWLNPAIWLSGPVLGYLDAQMAVPAALAILAAASDRPRLAGALAVLAVLTKPQAIFILPVLGMMLAVRDASWRPKTAVAAGIGGLAVAALAFAPFFVAGTWPSMLRAFQRFGEHDLVSGNATNVWWAITWAAGSAIRVTELGVLGALQRPATMVRISTAIAAGIPNPRLVGTVLTAASLAWAAWRSRRGLTAGRGALLGAWSVLAYFMLSAQVHENHAYLAIPLLGTAAALDPDLRRLYWLISAAYVLNLYLFYGLGMTLPPLIDRRWTLIDMTVVLAVAYGVLFLLLTRKVAAATR